MKAIRILKELAGDRRLVGIISHVTELKEQIDRKLLVTKMIREALCTGSWKTDGGFKTMLHCLRTTCSKQKGNRHVRNIYDIRHTFR